MRAALIIKINEMNLRWLFVLYFLIVEILAKREIGTSQHLKIIKGVERESVPKLEDRLCQIEVR